MGRREEGGERVWPEVERESLLRRTLRDGTSAPMKRRDGYGPPLAP